MPLIAAVIPALDQHDLTRRCVNTLLAASGDLEPLIIIVDDGSRTPYAVGDFPGAVIVRNDTNRGYTFATNRGIAHALEYQPDAILVANNDVEFRGEAVARLARGLGDFDLIGPLARTIVRGEQTLTSFIEFSCVLIRTTVFQTLGGLDARFTHGYYSDDDFCLRSQIAGFRLGHLRTNHSPDILHESGATFGTARLDRIKASYPTFLNKWGESEIPCVRHYIQNYLWNPDAAGFGKLGA